MSALMKLKLPVAWVSKVLSCQSKVWPKVCHGKVKIIYYYRFFSSTNTIASLRVSILDQICVVSIKYISQYENVSEKLQKRSQHQPENKRPQGKSLLIRRHVTFDYCSKIPNSAKLSNFW